MTSSWTGLSFRYLGQVGLFVLCTGAAHAGIDVISPGEPGDPGNYDADGSGRLDENELKNLYLKEIAKSAAERTEAKAAEFAADLITFNSETESKGSIGVNTARKLTELILQRMHSASESKDWVIGWRGLGFKRFVLDSANPRPGGKFIAPFVFSYRRDSTADKRDQLTVLGAVQLFQLSRDLDPDGISTVGVTPALELDIDTGKSGNESSLSASLPFYYTRAFTSRWIESLSLAVSPTFGTDRDFNREVIEGTIALTPTSPNLQAGYIWPRSGMDQNGQRPLFAVSWLPTFRVESGDVIDAAGNEDLERREMEGPYVRLTPQVDLFLYPWRLSERTTLQYQYFHRFDVANRHDYGYGEARFLYDIVAKGLVQFSVVYRNGRKPPDFGHVNDILIGIGIKQ